MESMYAIGHRVRFNDPEGLAEECQTQNIREWEHADILRIISFEIVEGERLPVCWNEDKQTASSVTYRSITGPELH